MFLKLWGSSLWLPQEHNYAPTYSDTCSNIPKCSNTHLVKMRTTSSTPTCFILYDVVHKSGLSCLLEEILRAWLVSFRGF